MRALRVLLVLLRVESQIRMDTRFAIICIGAYVLLTKLQARLLL